MRKLRRLPVAVAVAAGFAGTVLAAAPAVAGDTARSHGCAAHWRSTAAWNECVNATGVNVRLHVDCNKQFDHSGEWKYVRGTSNPVDRYECFSKSNSAWNGFR